VELVASVLFRSMHGGACIAQQGFRLVSAIWVDADTGRAYDINSTVFGNKWLLVKSADLGENGMDHFAIGDGFNHRYKAGKRVACRKHRTQAIGKSKQKLVSRLMAEAVVDCFE